MRGRLGQHGLSHMLPAREGQLGESRWRAQTLSPAPIFSPVQGWMGEIPDRLSLFCKVGAPSALTRQVSSRRSPTRASSRTGSSARRDEPKSIWEVMGRQKDVQYASRDDVQIARQKQLHQLRRVIRQLAKRLPASQRDSTGCRELAAYGCGTTMHIVRLLAPALASENLLKDIDFSSGGIRDRWEAGRRDALQMIERAPWSDPIDPLEGVVVHELSARTEREVRET